MSGRLWNEFAIGDRMRLVVTLRVTASVARTSTAGNWAVTERLGACGQRRWAGSEPCSRASSPCTATISSDRARSDRGLEHGLEHRSCGCRNRARGGLRDERGLGRLGDARLGPVRPRRHDRIRHHHRHPRTAGRPATGGRDISSPTAATRQARTDRQRPDQLVPQPRQRGVRDRVPVSHRHAASATSCRRARTPPRAATSSSSSHAATSPACSRTSTASRARSSGVRARTIPTLTSGRPTTASGTSFAASCQRVPATSVPRLSIDGQSWQESSSEAGTWRASPTHAVVDRRQVVLRSGRGHL